MKSVWVSVAVGVVLLVGVPLVTGWAWYTGIAPGVIFGLLTFAGIWWRVTQAVQAEMGAFQAMAVSMGQPKDEAEAKAFVTRVRGELTRIRDRWGDWMPTLHATLTGQLGGLAYQEGDLDAALPLLEQGSSQDAQSRTMLACLYYRRGRADDMAKAFGEAAAAQPKEALVYALWALLEVELGRSGQALTALGQGLTAVPGQPLLTLMRDHIANKRPVGPELLGEAWWIYFPDKLKALLTTPRTTPLDPAVVATLPAAVRAQYQEQVGRFERQMNQAKAARQQQQRRHPAARQ